MAAYPPIAIAKVKGSFVPDDGRYALIDVELTQGGSIMLDFPAEQLPQLLAAAADAAGRSSRILKTDPSQKHLFPVSWWTVGEAQDGAIVLSFQLPGGSELSFQLSRDAADRLQEVINAQLGRLPVSPPGQKKQ